MEFSEWAEWERVIVFAKETQMTPDQVYEALIMYSKPAPAELNRIDACFEKLNKDMNYIIAEGTSLLAKMRERRTQLELPIEDKTV